MLAVPLAKDTEGAKGAEDTEDERSAAVGAASCGAVALGADDERKTKDEERKERQLTGR